MDIFLCVELLILDNISIANSEMELAPNEETERL